MDASNAGEPGRKLGAGDDGKRDDAVLAALGVADDDAIVAELDVLDAQTQALEKAHPGPVEDRRDERGDPFRRPMRRRTSARVRTVGKSSGPLGTDDGSRGGEVLLEDVAVEKHEGRERLGLGRGADGALDGEMRDEGVDLGLGHLEGMALVVKEDVAADPADVGLLGAQAVVAGADRLAHAVEQARLAGLRRLPGERPRRRHLHKSCREGGRRRNQPARARAR